MLFLRRQIIIFVLSIAVLFTAQTFASPHPGMGSSAINQAEHGSVFSQMGFKLNTVPAGWNLIFSVSTMPADADTISKIQKTASVDMTKDFQIEMGKNFSSVSDHVGRISFKFEQTAKKIDLETYVKKYLRDYNQYGFDVSGLQSLREKNSVIVDINQKNKKTRSRQMFFQNGTRIVMATCVDEFDSFDKTIAECNQIFSGLSWK